MDLFCHASPAIPFLISALNEHPQSGAGFVTTEVSTRRNTTVVVRDQS